MPSKSKKQKTFMAVAAKDKSFATKAGIPPTVAKKYHNADRRRMTAMLKSKKGGYAG
tara:strand:+ start:378 stop:548 length:171 start_codon:yes stop_codon:yes gene_type:complete